MKVGTKVSILMGRYKGKRATVIARKGFKMTPDQVAINIIEGPVITIHKTFLK